VNTSLYQLLEFDGGAHHVLFLPAPQVLSKHFTAAGPEERIEFVLSVGCVRVTGRQLAALWSQVVSETIDRLAVGPLEPGGAITTITFELASGAAP